MLASEEQEVASSLKVKIGISPSVEVGAASEGLAGLFGSVFSCMMDKSNGEPESAGQVAQSGEDGGDLCCIVFIGALKPDIGVEDE